MHPIKLSVLRVLVVKEKITTKNGENEKVFLF